MALLYISLMHLLYLTSVIAIFKLGLTRTDRNCTFSAVVEVKPNTAFTRRFIQGTALTHIIYRHT